MAAGNCDVADALAAFKAACDGKQACAISHFAKTLGYGGQACAGLPKTAIATYKCKAAPPGSKCSKESVAPTKSGIPQVTMTCPDGTGIIVEDALAGLPSGTCGAWVASKTCDIPTALQQVRGKCQGKNKCTDTPWTMFGGALGCEGVDASLLQLATQYRCEAGALQVVKGLVGNAFRFGDGQTSNFQSHTMVLAGSSDYAPFSSFSIALWFRVPHKTVFAGRNPLLHTDENYPYLKLMRLFVDDNQGGGRLTWAPTCGPTLRSDHDVRDGQWHHFALTFQRRPSGQGDLALWLDGELQDHHSDATVCAIKRVAIGADSSPGDHPGVSNWKKGKLGSVSWIDELRVSPKSLSGQEIRALMRQATGNPRAAWAPRAGEGEPVPITAPTVKWTSPLQAATGSGGKAVVQTFVDPGLDGLQALTLGTWVKVSDTADATLSSLSGAGGVELRIALKNGLLAAKVRGTHGELDEIAQAAGAAA